MAPRKEQQVYIKFCEISVQRRPWQVFGEESMRHKQAFEWHAWFKAGHLSVDNNKRTGNNIIIAPYISAGKARSISSTMSDTVARIQGLTCKDLCWPLNYLEKTLSMTLLIRWWDMPTDSNCWTMYAWCCQQICIKDSDSWLEVAAYWHLLGVFTGRFQWHNLLFQGYCRWWELVVWLRSWNKATSSQWKHPTSPIPIK